MRQSARLTIGLAATAAIVALGAGTAEAAPPPTGTITSPAANTVVFQINNNADTVKRCGGRLEGFTNFSTPYQAIAPRSTTVYTVASVPAGNYSVRWLCDGHTGPRSVLAVSGVANPPSDPHLIPNGQVSPPIQNAPHTTPNPSQPQSSPNLRGYLNMFSMFSS